MRSAMEKLLAWIPHPARPDSSQESADGTPRTTFTDVYQKGLWGRKFGAKFYSGPGSHDSRLTGPYVASVSQFLATLPQPPAAVDLGCGDFAVGRQIRHLCDRYVACDVVPALIEHNQGKYGHLNVEFRCIDIAADALPAGDVAFVRQVLQHLSNEHIARFVEKLPQFRHVIVTEHLPNTAGFVANLDQPKGAGIRLAINSGVVLTDPPFGLRPKSARVLCSVLGYGGEIRTTLYEMR